MEIKNLHQPFQLEVIETADYHVKAHRKTFFEMVFVLEGEGIQSINDNQLPYAPNKLFLIFPQDKHGFEVKTKSRFFFIRFNESYLATQQQEWLQKIEFIFHNHNHLPGCILKNVTDKALVRSLCEALILEAGSDFPNQQEVTQQLINTLITIAARNITLMPHGPVKALVGDPELLLLNYIHENIYDPELLKAEKLAAKFYISPTYISEYFRKNFGESLQQYVMQYKLRLIETRLRYTPLRIGEIASEFGFTDESHLNRTFKKYKGLTPGLFRKNLHESTLRH